MNSMQLEDRINELLNRIAKTEHDISVTQTWQRNPKIRDDDHEDRIKELEDQIKELKNRVFDLEEATTRTT